MNTRKHIKTFLIGALLGTCGIAFAATFNLFKPATGVLKGNASTYVTTAATSADIRGLWTGTCDVTTFLRGDGACAAGGGGGSGTVTSVALTMPTGFSVGGSPITTSGTFAITTTLNGLLRGNGSGFTTGTVALGSEVTGTLPVANGGTGVATLTGVVKASGTSAFSAAASTDIRALWSGTCDSTTFLRGDGACTVAAGAGVGTVTSVGLTVPSGLSVSGSPVTSAGTLAITTALNGPMRGNGSGFTTGATALGSEVSGTLPVANGGSGAATLTGLLKGNGTSAFTAGASADVIGLWSGTCNASAYLRGDGACAVTPTGTVTSVSLTVPGIFTVTGSPVTTSGTLGIVASGTSGGIPYFSAATTLASSAVLTANRIVLGGGAGVAPTILGSLGTTVQVLHGNAAGAPTFAAVALASEVSGTLPVANGGTGVTTSTGTGSVVLSVSPAFTGSPTISGQNICQGNGTNCAAVSLTTGVTGTLPVANGGTGVTTSTGTGSTVLSASPALTGSPTVGGQAVCLANGTNCPAAVASTITRRTADLNRTSTTVAADTDMDIVVTNGQKLAFQCFWSVGNLSNADGLKIGFANSGGGSGGEWNVTYPLSPSPGIGLASGANDGSGTTLTSISNIGSPAVVITGRATISANGTFQPFWAPVVSGAGTGLEAGSWCRYDVIP